jgi:hypothetical protein
MVTVELPCAAPKPLPYTVTNAPLPSCPPVFGPLVRSVKKRRKPAMGAGPPPPLPLELLAPPPLPGPAALLVAPAEGPLAVDPLAAVEAPPAPAAVMPPAP